MRFDPTKLEIVALDESKLASVLRIAEGLEAAPRWPRDSYRELVSKSPPVPRIALVALDTQTGEAAGFVIARLTPPEAELESIGVAAAHQQRGIGRRLMGALIEQLEASRVERLYLEVRASNAPALALYRSVGFAETGRRPSYYADPQEDAILMELRIG